MKTALVALLVIALAGLTTAGELPVWLDSWSTGWSKHWSVSEVTDVTYAGSAKALKRSQVRVDGSTTAFIQNTPVLEFYVNLQVDAAYPGYHYTRLDVTLQDGTVMEFGIRGDGTTWYVEENGQMVEYTDAPVPFDTDPNTWQRVWIDLSQSYWVYTPTGEVARTPDLSKAIKLISASTYNSPSNPTTMTYYDNIRFITADMMQPDSSSGTVLLVH